MSSLPTWSPCLEGGTTDSLIITAYFNAGHKYKTILCFLCMVHGVVLSMRQLKRKLKRLGLRRCAPRRAENFRRVCHLIREELQLSGIQLGYRAMWRRLRQLYKVVISRDCVMKIVRQLSPIDSMLRKAHKLQRRVYHNKVSKL